MTSETQIEAAHVDVNPVATIEDAPAGRIELLDDDEVVELSIKPSLWFIAIVSVRVVAVAVLLAAAVVLASGDSGSVFAAYFVTLATLAAVVRVVVASMQWASRVYVLTNRRVMRLSGVLTVALTECALRRVEGTRLRQDPVQRQLRLGTICVGPVGGCEAPIVWEHVARAEEIHERVVRAIRKAQSKR